jgi:hypothetical protein
MQRRGEKCGLNAGAALAENNPPDRDVFACSRLQPVFMHESFCFSRKGAKHAKVFLHMSQRLQPRTIFLDAKNSRLKTLQFLNCNSQDSIKQPVSDYLKP